MPNFERYFCDDDTISVNNPLEYRLTNYDVKEIMKRVEIVFKDFREKYNKAKFTGVNRVNITDIELRNEFDDLLINNSSELRNIAEEYDITDRELIIIIFCNYTHLYNHKTSVKKLMTKLSTYYNISI